MERAPADASSTITRGAGLTALGTLGSRVLGAVRDAVIAASFALAETDAFFVAWTIPNALRRLLGEGAVSAAFVPVWSELDEQHGRERARRFFGLFAGALIAVLCVVSVVGVLAAPALTTIYAAGYRADAAKFEATALLTAIVFPYVLLAGVAALLTGALNAVGSFLLPALSPALLNVALIAAPFTLVPLGAQLGISPIASLGIASLAGGVLQILVQLGPAKRLGLLSRPTLAPRDPDVRRSLGLMAPLLLGTGIYQANILLSRLLASFLPDGALSFLYYAQRLVEIPQGMFAIAIASAALPSLARLHSQGDHPGALAAMRYSIRLTSLVALPCAVLLAVLAEPIVSVFFGRGAFGAPQIEGTASALAWLSIGVWAVAVIQPVTRMFYAYGDTKSPVVASAVNLAVFFGLSVLYAPTLAHSAIALGTSMAACLQLGVLFLLLRRHVAAVGARELIAGCGRHALACIPAALVAHAVCRTSDFSAGAGAGQIFTLGAALVLAGLTFVGVALLLGAEELRVVLRSLKQRSRGAAP